MIPGYAPGGCNRNFGTGNFRRSAAMPLSHPEQARGWRIEDTNPTEEGC